MPTVPTADEILDRSFRRAAKKRKEKINKDRANEEFVRAVGAAIHDRLVYIIRGFPEFEKIPLFTGRWRRSSTGSITSSSPSGRWAGRPSIPRWWATRLPCRPGTLTETLVLRKRAVARLASMVHQIDKDLRFLNKVRNTLRKLPHVEDAFTVVIAGYPNVGKSSFIRLVSSATPEIASYPFTTKGVIVGLREQGRDRIQFVDTPGILDRPAEERNPIERQALSAMMNVASVILFILDPSEHCGYPMEMQLGLLDEVKGMVNVPLVVVANKSDLRVQEGYLSMSTETKDGVDAVLEELLSHRPAWLASRKADESPADQKPEDSPAV